MSRYVLIFVLSAVSTTWAYPWGPPPHLVCDNLTPAHGVPPQASPFPYKLSVNKKIIKPGEEIEISLGGHKFRGFLVQLRDGNKSIGRFNIPADDKFTQSFECHNNPDSTVSHINADDKLNIKLKWTAPNQPGTFHVYATVVENYSTFWVEKDVETIKVE